VFNSPTNWAHEAMYLMFGMQYLIAGAYAVLTESPMSASTFSTRRLSKRRKRKAWIRPDHLGVLLHLRRHAAV
jgi:TRAP-type mannitol/chloroaromatic compound transport system permease small subunit